MRAMIQRTSRGVADTETLAARLAAVSEIGDVITLSGDLGAGKTAFARGFVRAMTERSNEVPSPTFTLVQTYDTAKGPLWHCDLYRLTRPEDAWELGLDEAFAHAICLIEWPERLGAAVPAKRLNIALGFISAAPDQRRVTFEGDEHWVERLKTMEQS